ncbi:MAG: hypothetical protein ACOYMN_14635, partial [Roseimicrobium sp.]
MQPHYEEENPSALSSDWMMAGRLVLRQGWPVLRASLRPFLLPLGCILGLIAHGAEPLPGLTSVRQTRQLTPEEAMAGRAVRLSGVITYLRLTDQDFNFSLHDETGGLMVYPAVRADVRPGQRVVVKGETEISSHGLRIAKATVEPGEMASPPPPVPVTLAALREGEHDGDYVEFQGLVRASRLESPEISPQRLALDFGPQKERLTAWVTDFNPGQDLLHPGSAVRVRGVVVRWTNPLGQVQSTSVLLNAMTEVQTVSPAAEPTDRTLAQLQTEAVGLAARCVRVTGQVTLQQPGLLVLQQGRDAVRVRPKAGAPLMELGLGRVVQATGFPALGEYTVELEDASLTVTENAAAEDVVPEPLPTARQVLRASQVAVRDARLVRLPARLVAQREDDARHLLELHSGDVSFFAALPPEKPWPALARPGSEVEVTGVCTMHLSDERRRLGRSPDTFSLLLRGPADLVVVKADPWWTAERLRLALYATAILTAWLVAWALLLRGKNRRLHDEIAARQRAEQELADERRRV